MDHVTNLWDMSIGYCFYFFMSNCLRLQVELCELCCCLENVSQCLLILLHSEPQFRFDH